MKKTNLIFAALLLSMLMTACGFATESIADNGSNATTATTVTESTTEAETEDAAAQKATESETETATTEALTTEAASTEAATTEAATTAATTTEAATTETAETSASDKQKEVFALNGPLSEYEDPAKFANARFAASFEKDDLVKAEDGTITLNVMIYRYELFSAEQVEALRKGDAIWCLGSKITIDTIETTSYGAIVINGGIEHGGTSLQTDDGAVYYESGMNDAKSYYEIGEKTYVLADDFVLTDSSDLDNPVTYTAEEFLTLEHGAAGFIEHNTLVKTTNDVITAIERRYIP